MSCLLNVRSGLGEKLMVETSSYVIEVGVPLRYIDTKICALFCGGIKPALTIACTRKTPMMGNSTILAIQTERIAAIGKRENGRGIFILAKKEPRSTRESGIDMAPTKTAIGERRKNSNMGTFYREAGLTNRRP